MSTTTARYWREIPQRYRLEAGKCTSCDAVYFPPRRICAKCKGREFETVTLPDEGKVVTHTVIRTPPADYSDQAPYAVAIVELDGGTRFTTQVVDCDLEAIAIGMPVRVEFRKILAEGESGVICYG
ncbi:MAG: Zn-ribbon domain-containing OB-fold protein, partial [bacterium]|nr:Zn-ribbon domain-containing OB-fold protein [bacterium]